MKIYLISALITLNACTAFSQEKPICPEGDKKILIESTIEKILPLDGYDNYFQKINSIKASRDALMGKYNECMNSNANLINQLLTLGIACDGLATEYNSLLRTEESLRNDFMNRISMLKGYLENLRIFYPTCTRVGEFFTKYTPK